MVTHSIPFVTFSDNGEVKIGDGIFENLIQQLCLATQSRELDEVWPKLKREIRVKIKTRFTYYGEVFSVPKRLVDHWIGSLMLKSSFDFCSNSDLEKGKYEGGFKVWESTTDLIKFVTEDQDLIGELLSNRTSKLKVLELGAGAALPSLALLDRLIKEPSFKSGYRLHLQDYNWQVLLSLTLLNLATNFHIDYSRALLNSHWLRLFHGDWKDFNVQSKTRYQLIMMSEVIYNADNYLALHALLVRSLKRNGQVVIATKNTYFGLSGGLYAWLEYVESQRNFNIIRTIGTSSKNIPRSILVMQKRA